MSVTRKRGNGVHEDFTAPHLKPSALPPRTETAGSPARIPLSVKLGTSLFVAVLVPTYWIAYGPTNFLWFSDVALLITAAALWLESRFLTSMMAVGVLVPEILWSIDFLFRLFTGSELTGGAAYMFDPKLSLALRGLSLFHLGLPLLLVAMLYRLGYDRRAWIAQTLVAWVVLPLSYLSSAPGDNINVVRGFAWLPYHRVLLSLEPIVAMLAVPLFLYFPTHLVLSRWFAPQGEGRSC